jgi:hypothetical protein
MKWQTIRASRRNDTDLIVELNSCRMIIVMVNAIIGKFIGAYCN